MSSFLGRVGELAELGELLQRSRLITLTGAPGVGKTRLALELAKRHSDPAMLVELAPISDPALVHRALASALSLQEVPGQDLAETVIAHLRERRLLLVLDNCEHLIGACAELVGSLLGGCSELSILATSREALALQAERVWQVPPLAVPGRGEAALPEALMSYTAVCLFVERAGAVQSGFVLNSYVAPAVAEICRRLDGIPLAIELAAARVEILTPAEIARRLDDRFSLLSKRSRGVFPRHQTLLGRLGLEPRTALGGRASAPAPPVGFRRGLLPRGRRGNLRRWRGGDLGDIRAARTSRIEVARGRGHRQLPWSLPAARDDPCLRY